MHFMYIHTHSPENCKIDKPQELVQMAGQIRETAKKANIKLTIYSAHHEHTIYALIEADNLAALEDMLIPLTKWGDASLIPVLPMEERIAAMQK
jgi:hypothetical protein